MKKSPFKALLLMTICAVTQTSHAYSGWDDFQNKAWVWADQPTSPSYEPMKDYQYNSQDKTNKIKRTGVGLYEVTFTGQAASIGGGIVHTTAYGGNHTCQVSNWITSGSNIIAGINCYKANSTSKADGKFTALFYKEKSAHNVFVDSHNDPAAHLMANKPTLASYTPSDFYQWNSRGASNTITRSSKGVYKAKLPKIGGFGGTAMVTAYGTTGARCKPASWGPTAANDATIVTVWCFDNLGAPSDSMFTLSFAWRTNFGVTDVLEQKHGAYVRADQKELSNYIPNPRYSFATQTETVDRIERLGKGTYKIHFPALLPRNSTYEQVVAYGNDNTYCTIRKWEGDSWPIVPDVTGTNAFIDCWAASGVKADSQFVLQHLTNGHIIVII